MRYDDPSVGRWTQQDPVGGSLFDPRSPNRYVYARCDPVNVTDPGGRQPVASCIYSLLFAVANSFAIDYGVVATLEELAFAAETAPGFFGAGLLAGAFFVLTVVLLYAPS